MTDPFSLEERDAWTIVELAPEPAVSVPSASGTSPRATATAEPASTSSTHETTSRHKGNDNRRFMCNPSAGARAPA